MAALRQLLNARGITKDPSEEDSRRIDAKMQQMGYSISPPIPTRLRSSRSEDQGQKPFQSKFNENDFAQHPLYRGGDQQTGQHGNSFDDPSRPQLSRSATDDHLHQAYAMNDGRNGMDVSSYYEDGEQSPALSPALNKHLALRPLDPHAQPQQQQQYPSQPKHGRRRSRSATDDNLYYAGDREDNTVSKDHRKHKPRQESLLASSTKPLPETRSDEKLKERTMQLLRDRQQTPTQNNNVCAATISLLHQLTHSIYRADSHPNPSLSPMTKPPRSHTPYPAPTAPRPTPPATASATALAKVDMGSTVASAQENWITAPTSWQKWTTKDCTRNPSTTSLATYPTMASPTPASLSPNACTTSIRTRRTRTKRQGQKLSSPPSQSTNTKSVGTCYSMGSEMSWTGSGRPGSRNGKRRGRWKSRLPRGKNGSGRSGECVSWSSED